MKLKNFTDYAAYYSKDPKNFEKRVVLACSENYGVAVFKHIKESSETRTLGSTTPVILWNNFKYPTTAVNESYIFNTKSIPTYEELCEKFDGNQFIPKSTTDRAQVKGLKFPITGVDGDASEVFKTFGKFRKSERHFPIFREKKTPTTRFDVLAFKDRPIHVQEKTNTLGFDVNPARFKYLDQVNTIIESISSEYPLDFYHLGLVESGDTLYLDAISTSLNLSPSQSIKMYESAYEDFYVAKLPNWFKTQLFETYVKPYYKKRYYDAALLKPKHSIDFKKYVG